MDFSGDEDTLLVTTTASTTTRLNMWLITAIRVEGSLPAVIFSVNSTHMSPVTCGSGGCTYVSMCVVARRASSVVCSLAMPQLDRLVLLRLDGNSGAVIGKALTVGGAFNMTAAVVDEDFGFLLAAVYGSLAVSVIRVQMADMQLVSSEALSSIEGERPTVLRMTVNATTRSLYISLATPTMLRMMVQNLFGLTAVSPAVIDQQGGAVVTFTGVGFVVNPVPLCVFNRTDSRSTASAVFVDSNTLLCVAPVSPYHNIFCDTLTVNVVFGNRSTNTTVMVTRPTVAVPVSATSNVSNRSAGWHATASIVTLEAEGLVNFATHAACRLMSSDRRTTYFTSPVVGFPSSTSVKCLQPSLPSPTPPGSILVYSHDGTVFSSLGAPFVVVGLYSQLGAAWASNETTSLSVRLMAAASVPLPSIRLATQDALGNELRSFDVESRELPCGLLEPSLAAGASQAALSAGFTPATLLVGWTTEGVAVLRFMSLAAPTQGSATLHCYEKLDITKAASLRFTVTPGLPTALLLTSSTSAWVAGVTQASSLTPPPSVAAVDEAGNRVTDMSLLPAALVLTYLTTIVSDSGGSTPNGTMLVSLIAKLDGTGVYAFDAVRLRTTFGAPVTLQFTGGRSLVLRHTVGTELCSGARPLAVSGTFTCLQCPANAACDGSTEIEPAVGYWRSTARSLVMYACAPAASCATAMSCAAGYRGAVCGSCTSGYGRSGAGSPCEPCNAAAINWVVTASVLMAMCAAIFLLSVSGIPFSSITDREAGVVPNTITRNPVPLVVKIALSHLQMLALLPFSSLSIPSWLQSLLSGASQGSATSINVAFIPCATGNSGAAQLLTATAELPILLTVFVIVAGLLSLAHHYHFLRVSNRSLRAARHEAAKSLHASPVKYAAADAASVDVLINSAAGIHVGNDDEMDPDVAAAAVLRSHRGVLGWYDGDDPDGTFTGSSRNGLRGSVIRTDPTAAALHDALSQLTDISAPSVVERFMNTFAVAAVVVMFFVYPTLVQAAIAALQCRTIDLGDGAETAVLLTDASIDCSSSDGVSVRRNGALLLAFGGVGIPLLCPVVVLSVRRWTCRGGLDAARELFHFATGGFRASLWFWESVVMVRKASLAVAVALCTAGQLQFIGATWVLIGFGAATVHASPWEQPLHRNVDMCSLVALAGSSLLLAASTTSQASSNDAWLTLLYALVFVLNVVFLAVAGVSLMRAVQQHAVSLSKHSPAVAELIATFDTAATRIRLQQLRRKLERLQSFSQAQTRTGGFKRQLLLLGNDTVLTQDLCAVRAVIDLLIDEYPQTCLNHEVVESVARRLPKRHKEQSFVEIVAAMEIEVHRAGPHEVVDCEAGEIPEFADWLRDGEGGHQQVAAANERHRDDREKQRGLTRRKASPLRNTAMRTTSIERSEAAATEQVCHGNGDTAAAAFVMEMDIDVDDAESTWITSPASGRAGADDTTTSRECIRLQGVQWGAAVFWDAMESRSVVDLHSLSNTSVTYIADHTANTLLGIDDDIDVESVLLEDFEELIAGLEDAVRPSLDPLFGVPDDDIDIEVAEVEYDRNYQPNIAGLLRELPALFRIPDEFAACSTTDGGEDQPHLQDVFSRALRNAHRAQCILHALHHVLPRRITSSLNYAHLLRDDSITTAQQQHLIQQHMEALFAAEAVVLLSWLRVLRLCRQRLVPLITTTASDVWMAVS